MLILGRWVRATEEGVIQIKEDSSTILVANESKTK